MSKQEKLPICPECRDTEHVTKTSDGFECTDCEETYQRPVQHFTDWVVVSSSSTYPPKLHIKADDEDKPICDRAPNGEYRPKPADAFPLYYASMCSYCRDCVEGYF